MLSTDGSPGRLGPATSTDALPNSLRKDGVRFLGLPGWSSHRVCWPVLDLHDGQPVQAQQPGSIVNRARGFSVVIGLLRQQA